MQMGYFLYNGVPLAQIPEDKDNPFATIVNVDGVYVLGLSRFALEAYNSGDVMLEWNLSIFIHEDGQWVSSSFVDFPSVYPAIWANYDLYYKTADEYGELSGTLYLAASEPVPVGIAPKIDPFSMTMGWLIGCRIAGQRGKAG